MSEMIVTTAALRKQRAASRGKAHLTYENLALVLLFATVLYSMVGIPDFDRETTLETDHVSPLNRWIWIALLTAATPILRKNWRATLTVLRASWALLLLLGYFFISTRWALDESASVRRLISTLLQFFLLITLVSTVESSSSLQRVVVLASTLVAIGDVATWLVWPGFAMTDEGFAGFQGQKNQTGLLMMYGCLAGGTACFLPATRWVRAACCFASLLMFSILILTRSTTSQTVVLLAPVLMIIVWLLGHLSDRGLLAVLSAAFCAIALPLFVYFACCAVVGSDPWRPLHGVTFTDRLDLWQFLAEEISKRPWLGAGYGSFWAINAAVQPSLQRPTWFSLYAIINEGHDGYLDLLATGGIIGLAGGLFVVFQGVGRAFRAVQSGGAMARPTALFHTAFLLGLLIHNATESNLFSNQASLAVALMLCLLDLNKAHAATSGAAAQLRINRRSATVNAGAR